MFLIWASETVLFKLSQETEEIKLSKTLFFYKNIHFFTQLLHAIYLNITPWNRAGHVQTFFKPFVNG